MLGSSIAVIVVTLAVFAAMGAPDIVAALGWQPATLEIDRGASDSRFIALGHLPPSVTQGTLRERCSS